MHKILVHNIIFPKCYNMCFCFPWIWRYGSLNPEEPITFMKTRVLGPDFWVKYLGIVVYPPRKYFTGIKEKYLALEKIKKNVREFFWQLFYCGFANSCRTIFFLQSLATSFFLLPVIDIWGQAILKHISFLEIVSLFFFVFRLIIIQSTILWRMY